MRRAGATKATYGVRGAETPGVRGAETPGVRGARVSVSDMAAVGSGRSTPLRHFGRGLRLRCIGFAPGIAPGGRIGCVPRRAQAAAGAALAAAGAAVVAAAALASGGPLCGDRCGWITTAPAGPVLLAAAEPEAPAGASLLWPRRDAHKHTSRHLAAAGLFATA